MAGFGEPRASVVDAAGLTVGVVAARWHAELTDHMVDRAMTAAKAIISPAISFGSMPAPGSDMVPNGRSPLIANTRTPNAKNATPAT